VVVALIGRLSLLVPMPIGNIAISDFSSIAKISPDVVVHHTVYSMELPMVANPLHDRQGLASILGCQSTSAHVHSTRQH